MKKVIRTVLIGLAICTVAIPDMGSEILKKIKGIMRDLKNKTADSIKNLAKGLSKSSAEKSDETSVEDWKSGRLNVNLTNSQTITSILPDFQSSILVY